MRLLRLPAGVGILVMQRTYQSRYMVLVKPLHPVSRRTLRVHYRCEIPGASGSLGVCPLLGFFLLLLVLNWHKKILSFERVNPPSTLTKHLTNGYNKPVVSMCSCIRGKGGNPNH